MSLASADDRTTRIATRRAAAIFHAIMPDHPRPFSDYIVYVDESGDPALTGVNSHFPVFALAFCIFRVSDYIDAVVPAMQRLKFRHWGHDGTILHEHEIRKRLGDYSGLMADRRLRETFLGDLHQLVADAPFRIIASVIDKAALKKQYSDPWSPYNVALHLCLERLNGFMLRHGQSGRVVNVIFECRGKNEDRALELEFRRVLSNGTGWGYRQINFSDLTIAPRFAPKAANLAGLQLADLVARPVSLYSFRPDQKNRTYEVLREKLEACKMFP